ncbi:hypothetical protein AAVH_25839 [Aphelenchoides avenae]|nr:hypothetical protein AAVH_25839 [Aphelenchus avenae]
MKRVTRSTACEEQAKRLKSEGRKATRLPSEVFLDVAKCVDYGTDVALAFVHSVLHSVIPKNSGLLARKRWYTLLLNQASVCLDGEGQHTTEETLGLPSQWPRVLQGFASFVGLHAVRSITITHRSWLQSSKVLFKHFPATRFAEELVMNYSPHSLRSVQKIVRRFPSARSAHVRFPAHENASTAFGKFFEQSYSFGPAEERLRYVLEFPHDCSYGAALVIDLLQALQNSPRMVQVKLRLISTNLLPTASFDVSVSTENGETVTTYKSRGSNITMVVTNTAQAAPHSLLCVITSNFPD